MVNFGLFTALMPITKFLFLTEKLSLNNRSKNKILSLLHDQSKANKMTELIKVEKK